VNNSKFDTTDLDELDREIQDHMARPTLVKKLKGQNKRKKATEMSWEAELQEYWYVYLFLAVSALFTGTLGFYMGLAPYPTESGLYFQTDPMHLFLAFAYLTAFVTVTEGAFALAKRRFFTREEKNSTQQWTMLFMMGIAGLSIVFTGIAGGMVIASNISFMTAFVHIPEAAQRWVVIVIPVLLAAYTFLVTAYHLSSDAAASERITREQMRELELDHRTRQRAVEQIAQEQLQAAELKLYKQMVEEGRVSAATAQAAIRAGKTLSQLEGQLGRDIDGDGHIGAPRQRSNGRMRAAAMAQTVRTPLPPDDVDLDP